jgi:hypothetical protein
MPFSKLWTVNWLLTQGGGTSIIVNYNYELAVSWAPYLSWLKRHFAAVEE